MKTNKGFTIVEAAITLGIMALGLGLSAVAFSNLGRIQTTATDQLLANKEINEIDNIVSRYVSFVSINNGDLSYSCDSIFDSNQISFVSNYGNSYTLSFANNNLSLLNNYSGSDEYFNFSYSKDFSYVSDLKFDYDSNLGLLISKISYLSNKTIRYSYVVRSQL